MGITANYKLPYPESNAKANVPEDIKKLAETADIEFGKKVDKRNGYGLSKNDFTDELKQKLDGLENYNDSKLQEKIENLEKENAEQQEELEALWNDFKPNTVTGESAIVNDGVKGSKVEVIGVGNSYQETTEGYNLIDRTQLELGSLSGADDAYGSDYAMDTRVRSNYISVEPNTEFTIQTFESELLLQYLCEYDENKKGSKVERPIILVDKNNYTFTSTATTKYIRAIFRYSDNRVMNVATVGNLQMILGKEDKPYEPYTNGASPNTEYEQPIEVIEGVNLLQVDETNWELIDKGIKNLAKNSGVKLNKVNITLKANTTYYFNFVLLDRPSGDTSFVSYIDSVENKTSSFPTVNDTAMYETGKVITRTYTPTKDELFSIKMWGNANSETFEFQYWITTVPNVPYLPYGHIGVMQRGIQLLDYTKGYNYNDNSSIELIDNGVVLNATDNNKRVIAFKTDLKANESYIVDYQVKNISGNAPSVNVYLPSLEQYLKLRTPFTPKKDTKIIAIYIDQNYLPSVAEVTKIRLYKEADKDKPYEPYIEPIVHSIDLAGNSIAKVGDIKDLLNIGVNGSVKANKTMSDFIRLTSDMVWSLSSNKRWYYTAILELSIKENSNILCTHFKKSRWNATMPSSSEICLGNTVSGVVGISATTFESIDALKTFLDENEVYIIGQLAEPQTINLPSIKPIKLIEGTNVFELVTNLGTTLSVTYKVSNNARLEALEKALLI